MLRLPLQVLKSLRTVVVCVTKVSEGRTTAYLLSDRGISTSDVACTGHNINYYQRCIQSTGQLYYCAPGKLMITSLCLLPQVLESVRTVVECSTKVSETRKTAHLLSDLGIGKCGVAYAPAPSTTAQSAASQLTLPPVPPLLESGGFAVF